jgi:hypothetical protein
MSRAKMSLKQMKDISGTPWGFEPLNESGFSKMSLACFRFAFDETARSRFAGGVRTDSQQVEPTPALAPLRQHLLVSSGNGAGAVLLPMSPKCLK